MLLNQLGALLVHGAMRVDPLLTLEHPQLRFGEVIVEGLRLRNFLRRIRPFGAGVRARVVLFALLFDDAHHARRPLVENALVIEQHLVQL